MPKITFFDSDGESEIVDAEAGISLMEAAIYHGVEGIVAECGGNRLCATCHVYVSKEWVERLTPREEGEEELLAELAVDRRENSRLSCQIRLTDELDGLVVTTPVRQR